MAVEWNSWKRAKEGTWCCRYCSVIFPTRNKLLEHYRMKFIKEKLNCRFFRYNEKLNLLYEC